MLVQLGDLIDTEYHPSSVNPGIVDRVKLRNTLAQGIEDCIQWNKHFVSYEEFPDRVVAHFEDGTTAEADLLIGADGAKSKVRAQRCPQLEYQSVHVSCSFSKLPLPAESEIPLIRKYTKDSMLRLLGLNGHTILLLRYKEENDQDQIWWAMTYPTESNEATNEDGLKASCS